ncbi:MAG: hypothetical protein ACFFDN_02175 [Candidatus Hodarchaeota archaeon]
MEFLQVKDLEPNDKGFDIIVKVIKKESDKVVTIKKTGMQNRVANFLVGDETGQALLTVWGVDIDKIPIGKVITIQKSYVREFNNKLYLNIGKFSSWEVSKDDLEVKEKPQANKTKINSHIKICNVPWKKKGINLDKVKVLEITNIRSVKVRKDGSEHEVADALLGDDTGCIKCALWDEDIRKIEEDMILRIHNAYVTEYRGLPQLNLSRFSKYEILHPEEMDIDIENNLSLKEKAQT